MQYMIRIYKNVVRISAYLLHFRCFRIILIISLKHLKCIKYAENQHRNRGIALCWLCLLTELIIGYFYTISAYKDY